MDAPPIHSFLGKQVFKTSKIKGVGESCGQIKNIVLSRASPSWNNFPPQMKNCPLYKLGFFGVSPLF